MRTRMTTVLIAAAFAVAAAPSAATASPAVAKQSGDYVATIRVGGMNGELFRLHLVEDADITAAFANMRGQTNHHPNGLVVRTGPELNAGYSWHIDPNDVTFVRSSGEVCDGLPSGVENGTITSDRYCPWVARVVRMLPVI